MKYVNRNLNICLSFTIDILKVEISKGVLLFIFTFLFTQYHKVASKSVMSKATRSIVAINRM